MDGRYRKAIDSLESQEPVLFGARDFHRSLPQDPGVYAVSYHTDNVKEVLYIGKASSLRDRLYYNLLQGDDAAHTLRERFTTRRDS